MQYSKFFQEILNGRNLIVTAEGMAKYKPYLVAHSNGKVLEFPEIAPLQVGLFDETSSQIRNILQGEEKPDNTVAVLPLEGVLTRSGSWWDYGTDDLAEQLDELVHDESIKAVVLRTHCAGGTTHSLVPMEAVLRKNRETINKPIIQAVDSARFSAAEYIGSFCHKSFATHKMAEVGSIGVMARMQNADKFYKEKGIEYIEVVPPESKWKNKAQREAKKGNTKLLIEEELTPWALHFQETMRANRPNIDEDVEGILEGRTFFAYDGVKNGLLDGIMPFKDILEYAFSYTERQALESF